MKFLYFHGGPGFNSHPEKNLLQNRFAAKGWDVRFWNEPSVLRPNGPAFREFEAFENLLDSAEAFFLENYSGQPLVLIGHSFGAHAVCHLALLHPEKIAKAVFVAPDLALTDADRSLFNAILHDYRAHGDERHERLKELLMHYTSTFNSAAKEGFSLISQNPRVFNYYWSNEDQMEPFYSYFSANGYGIDLNGFLQVRQSFREIPLEGSRVPATTIFGEKDVCISEDAETVKLKKRFTNLTIHRLAHSAHYPHIEETDLFLKILETEIA